VTAAQAATGGLARGETALRDGHRVTIRLLNACDADALVTALRRADPTDLRRRFRGVPPPVSLLIRQLERADGVHDVALGAFDEHGRLVAVAQFDRPDDRPTAEVAIEVAHDWQHRGLGVELLGRLADLARQRGMHEFTATYFADNIAIQRLLRDVGHVVTSRYESGEGHMQLSLDEVRDGS
jgi:RimJ/RimL family protein N-acetyltransferase